MIKKELTRNERLFQNDKVLVVVVNNTVRLLSRIFQKIADKVCVMPNETMIMVKVWKGNVTQQACVSGGPPSTSPTVYSCLMCSNRALVSVGWLWLGGHFRVERHVLHKSPELLDYRVCGYKRHRHDVSQAWSKFLSLAVLISCHISTSHITNGNCFCVTLKDGEWRWFVLCGNHS